jgi:transporter family protein
MKVALLLFVTMLLWGIAPIFDKLAIMRANAFVGTTVRTAIVAVILVVAVAASGRTKEMLNIDPKALLYFTLSGVIAGCLGVYTYYAALKLGETSKIVPLAASYPLVTAVLSVFFLGEAFSLVRLIGVVLIVAGIWLVK